MKKIVLSLMLPLLFAIACSKDSGNVEGPDPAKQSATLAIRLTDAPPSTQIEEILIDIQELKINFSTDFNSSPSIENWQTITIKKGVYDLLQFRNGIDTLISKINLPIGKVHQIRMVLGTQNKIKTGGVYYDLTTPSVNESGLKFNVNAELKEGIEYKLWIDFDASRSIVQTGNGKFILKPVIRTFNDALTGSIKGVVNPKEAITDLLAIKGTDTLGALTSNDGKFLIRGVAQGDYKVILKPRANYQTVTIENKTVVNGSVTDLGTINLVAIQQ